jgi:hypothetical protein
MPIRRQPEGVIETGGTIEIEPGCEQLSGSQKEAKKIGKEEASVRRSGC